MPDQTPETRCPGCDGPPGPSPMAECIDPFHNRHPAPPDLEAAVERNDLRVLAEHLRSGRTAGISGLAWADAIEAVLAAYEQAEARADTWKGIAESHRDENLRLEAERDAAQASEARMREALERIADPETRWGRDVRNPVTHMRREARATLASTPNPEERCQCSNPCAAVWEDRALASEASEARLRAAVEWIAAGCPDPDGEIPSATERAAESESVARAALASTPNPEERCQCSNPCAAERGDPHGGACQRGHGHFPGSARAAAPDPTPEPEEGRDAG